MNAAETSVWRRYLHKPGIDMSLDLRGLTFVAFLRPTMDIMLETMPNKTGRDNPSCWFVTWMRESMNDLEYVLCPIPQDNGPACPFQWKHY